MRTLQLLPVREVIQIVENNEVFWGAQHNLVAIVAFIVSWRKISGLTQNAPLDTTQQLNSAPDPRHDQHTTFPHRSVHKTRHTGLIYVTCLASACRV
jgi:hypothetical protein